MRCQSCFEGIFDLSILSSYNSNLSCSRCHQSVTCLFCATTCPVQFFYLILMKCRTPQTWPVYRSMLLLECIIFSPPLPRIVVSTAKWPRIYLATVSGIVFSQSLVRGYAVHLFCLLFHVLYHMLCILDTQFNTQNAFKSPNACSGVNWPIKREECLFFSCNWISFVFASFFMFLL